MRTNPDYAELLALLGLAAVEQTGIDAGRWALAWQITMLPEPPWRLVSRPVVSEQPRPYSRLLEPRLQTALTGNFKDLATLDELKKKYAKPPPQRGPKAKGKGQGDEEEP